MINEAAIADKGLLLKVGCSNQGQLFSRRVPAESRDLMQGRGLLYRFFQTLDFVKRLSFKGRQSLEIADQDYGLGPPSAVIVEQKNRS